MKKIEMYKAEQLTVLPSYLNMFVRTLEIQKGMNNKLERFDFDKIILKNSGSLASKALEYKNEASQLYSNVANIGHLFSRLSVS
jgi:hypothetical protein